MMHYIIPARQGSKGLPLKNRKLLPFTLNSMPKNVMGYTIVSTDDFAIAETAKDYGARVHHRSHKVSCDTASTKDLLLEIADHYKLPANDELIMMYLTYPERTFEDVEKIHKFFKDNNGTSLLCREEASIHPYLSYYELEGHKGKKLVEHDLYRRQDYPKCFVSNHFLAIIKVEYLHLVDRNLYHPQTLFYDLGVHAVDVDTPEDLAKFMEGQ